MFSEIGKVLKDTMDFEKWDILNDSGMPTGRTAIRGKYRLKQGEYHLVVHIWVVSREGMFLIQRRSDSKMLMPGEWAATGGAAVSGEDSFTAAQRELFEELGIITDKETLKKLFRIKRKNSFLDVWFTESNLTLSELKLQQDEVAEARWVTLPELKKMIDKKQYHNYGNEYFDRVFKKIDYLRGATV